MAMPTEEVNVHNDCIALSATELQELHIQRELLDRPPFNVPVKKLVDAFKLIERGRVQRDPEHLGHWLVQGSKGDPYVVTKDGCSCPHGQRGTKTRFGCYHAVGVELYERWHKAMTPLTLPLPPTTIDAPFAQPVAAKDMPMAAPQSALPMPETALGVDAGTPSVTSVAIGSTGGERSPEIALLVRALTAAQQAIKNPPLDSTNPHFRSRYPSLAGIRDAITPHLTAQGLALTQLVATEATDVLVTSVLWHVSGQFLSTTLRLPVTKADAQGYGSTLTYARRYALLGLLNVAGDEDDDGEQGAIHTPRNGLSTQAAPASGAPEAEKAVPRTRTTTELQQSLVYTLKKLYGFSATTKEEYASEVFARTGLRLVPENYGAIVDELQARLAEAEAQLTD